MTHHKPFAGLAAILVVVTDLFASIALPAPGPKSDPADKVPAEGIPAEPAEGDAAKQRATSELNLERIAQAVINYADDHNGRLPADIVDRDGKPILSWRVHLLPYLLNQAELHKQFKLDEPWDSDANKKLLAKMPKVFDDPRVKVRLAGHTVYQGFAGPDAVFEPGKQLLFPASIPDGTSNTIMFVESSVAVAWTKPADLPFDEKKDLPDFGKAYGSKPLIVMCDGSTRVLDLTRTSAKTIKAAITRSGGEVLGPDW
jgi:hypothetical protein